MRIESIFLTQEYRGYFSSRKREYFSNVVLIAFIEFLCVDDVRDDIS